MRKNTFTEIMYAKAGCVDKMQDLISNNKYPRNIKVNENTSFTFENIKYQEINNENMVSKSMVMSFGISMEPAGIKDNCLILLKKEDLKNIKKNTVIAIKMENNCKLRLFNRVENNLIFVDKYKFNKEQDCFEIVPSSSNHNYESYIGSKIKAYSQEETKEKLSANQGSLEVETKKILLKNRTYCWETSFKSFLEFMTADEEKYNKSLIEFLKSYDIDEEKSREKFNKKIKMRIELNRQVSDTAISRILTQIQYSI